MDYLNTFLECLWNILNIIFSPDLIKIWFPILGTALLWFINEKEKRISEEYKRKVEKYNILIECLQGFYEGIGDEEALTLKTTFLKELNKCWLYCPDEVIQKAYFLLGMVHTNKIYSDIEKQDAVGDLILAIRKDLISREPIRITHLTKSDFRHLKANTNI